MTLNRGALARIDAKLRAELDDTDRTQLVKVPTSEAVWSTWRRYCDLASIPMGRALAVLLHNELASLVDGDIDDLVQRIHEREAELKTRAAEVKASQKDLEAGRRDLFFRETDLAEREHDLKDRENNVALVEHNLAQELMKRTGSQPGTASSKKPGRNDPCWCGSGKKYKKCHLRFG